MHCPFYTTLVTSYLAHLFMCILLSICVKLPYIVIPDYIIPKQLTLIYMIFNQTRLYKLIFRVPCLCELPCSYYTHHCFNAVLKILRVGRPFYGLVLQS